MRETITHKETSRHSYGGRGMNFNILKNNIFAAVGFAITP
jgi:hypothetical protein